MPLIILLPVIPCVHFKKSNLFCWLHWIPWIIRIHCLNLLGSVLFCLNDILPGAYYYNCRYIFMYFMGYTAWIHILSPFAITSCHKEMLFVTSANLLKEVNKINISKCTVFPTSVNKSINSVQNIVNLYLYITSVHRSKLIWYFVSKFLEYWTTIIAIKFACRSILIF